MSLDQSAPFVPYADHSAIVITLGEKRKTFPRNFRIKIAATGYLSLLDGPKSASGGERSQMDRGGRGRACARCRCLAFCVRLRGRQRADHAAAGRAARGCRS
jgi:hypothetical protein